MSKPKTIAAWLKTTLCVNVELSACDTWFHWSGGEWLVWHKHQDIGARIIFRTPDESALVKWLVEHE